MKSEVEKTAQRFLDLLDNATEYKKQAEAILRVIQADAEQPEAPEEPPKRRRGKTKAEGEPSKPPKKKADPRIKEARLLMEKYKKAHAEAEKLAAEMPEDAVNLVRNSTVNPYADNIADRTLKGTAFNFIHTNMSAAYMRRELMVSLVGFVFQIAEEYQREPEEELIAKLNNHDTSEEEKEEYEKALTALSRRRQWLRDFLNHIFEFDPLEHIRGSHLHRLDPNGPDAKLAKTKIRRTEEYVDVDRAELKNPDSGAFVLRERDEDGSMIERVVKKRTVEEVVEQRDPEAAPNPDNPNEEAANELLRHNVPADTFARWVRFHDSNYEGLRRAVQIAYAEKPDIETALLLCSAHVDDKPTKPEPKTALEKARSWLKVEQDRLPCDVMTAKLADGWTLLGPWSENRERIDFYNKHTEALKLVMDQTEEDAKIQRELMEKRIERKKRENVREAGPDDPNFRKDYRAVGTTELSKYADRPLDGNKMKAIEDGVDEEEARDDGDLDADGESSLDALLKKTEKSFISGPSVMGAIPDEAVAVDVHVHNPRTGRLERKHFLSESTS